MASNNDITVTNPGLVNVADEAFGSGLSRPVPAIGGPPTGAVRNVDGGESEVDLVSADQAVKITPPMTALRTVSGDAGSPLGPSVFNTTENTVIGQSYGTGTPVNVFH